jgi:outer membrane protein OmpU
MKKGLLATSALVGASLLGVTANAAPPTVADNLALTITGNMRTTLIAYNQDQSADITGNATDLARGYTFRGNDESEIVFRARGKADNGLTYGFDVEVQTQTDDTAANSDEVWFWVESPTMGRIEIGDQDDAADRMMIDGADAQAGRGGNNFSIDTGMMVRDHGLTALDSAGITVTGDNSKVIYFTPRWSGLQLGFSFTPDAGQDGGENVTAPTAPAPAFLNTDADGNNENVFALGVNYQGKFSGADVILAAVYSGGTATTNNATGALNEDVQIWGLGTQIKYAGFTFGAGYADFGETGITVARAAAGADAGSWWNIGLMYTTGPWDFSAGYFSGTASAASTDANRRDLEHTNIAVSATYRVAPGWVLASDVIFFDMQNRTPATAGADDVDGWMFVLSSTLTF